MWPRRRWLSMARASASAFGIEVDVGVDQRFVTGDARLVHLHELLRREQPRPERVLQLIDGGLHELHLTRGRSGGFWAASGNTRSARAMTTNAERFMKPPWQVTGCAANPPPEAGMIRSESELESAAWPRGKRKRHTLPESA